MFRSTVLSLAAAFFLSAAPAGAGFSFADEKKETLIAAKSERSGDVFLLRGFGNVFSRGLDQMGSKLKKRGIKAEVVHHGDWLDVTNKIISNRKKYGRRPVVLIGHSLGANAILRVAERLKKRKITIDYMVTFAATNPRPVPSNVRKLTNYYFKTDGWGEAVKKGAGFRGILKNIDFSNSKTIGHFNIDKQPRLQKQVINNVLRFVPRRRRAEATDSDKKKTAG